MLRAARLWLICLVAVACVPARAPQPPATSDAILILISFDGWRNDYTDLADAPNLRALAARGVRAQALIPSFPSKTFPNHYTIVTGLYPAHHGIVSNNIWDDEINARFSMSAETAKDARWWWGEPLWVTAIKQGRRASSMFWPGSEVAIGGVRPTDFKPFDDKFPNADRVKQILTWLALPESQRPSFLTLYFSDVDTAGHDYGPAQPGTLAAAARVDAQLGALVAGVESLGLMPRTTIMVVSDHGMSALAPERRIFLDDYVDLATVEAVDTTPILQIGPRNDSKMTVDELYRRLHGKHPALAVYRREDLPARLHFSGNPRIQPVIGIADDGWAITTHARYDTAVKEDRLSKGDHGYDPKHHSMDGLFVAAGPMLKQGVRVPAFENVHVYELMCKLLGLKPAKNDGELRATRGLLR